MTREFLTVCVALAGVTALAVWALSSRAEWKATATRRDEQNACLRVERDNLKAQLKLDPDTPVETRMLELTRERDDAVRLLQAETSARVAAQHQAALLLGELMLVRDGEPAGADVVDMGRWV